ncbi:hypothetical protein AGR7B_pAt0090 [Agrobacterium deltaense RV3]|nr:hypothetical protein AGR7B_pAt0090 [Agrobacterium deltaense RV3]
MCPLSAEPFFSTDRKRYGLTDRVWPTQAQEGFFYWVRVFDFDALVSNRSRTRTHLIISMLSDEQTHDNHQPGADGRMHLLPAA